MPELNLFLFLSLTLAGFVVYYLYHLDFSDDGAGHDPASHRSDRVFIGAESRPVRTVQTKRKTDAMHPAAFFDLSERLDAGESATTGIMTDFMVVKPDRADDSVSCGEVRCA